MVKWYLDKIVRGGSETVMSEPVILVADEISEDQRLAITAPLGEFSAARGFAFRAVALALLLREDDDIVGGLIEHTNWDWLHIEILSVATHVRGRGYGGSLWTEPKKSHAPVTALELGSIPIASNRRVSISVSATAFSAPCRATPEPSSVSSS
jgi:hypothetical protein